MTKNIEPNLKLISDYLKLGKEEKFVIPEYQRGYSWNRDTHCEKLWQDIETFIRVDSNDDPYFFGTIIADCSENNELKLIDGQQRTTTFLLLLKAMLINLSDIIDEIKDASMSQKTAQLLASLEDSYNIIMEILYKADAKKRIAILNNWNEVNEVLILENMSINESYKNEITLILAGKTLNDVENNVNKIPHKQRDNKYTNYFRNFKYFYDKLKALDSTKLDTFAEVFLKECQIIEIRSWQIEQAITMFNSLNSTGMPLADSDIISAQMYSKAGDSKEIFNEKWESINQIANKLNAQKITNVDALLQQFMYFNRAAEKEYMKGDSVDVVTPALRRYYTIEKKELLETPLILCDNLIKLAQIWDKIKDFPIVKLLLKFNENAKLYLASYLYRYDAENIIEEKCLDVCECLLRLFTILEVVEAGYSSKNFKTFLFGINVKLADGTVSIHEIKQVFDKHISKNWSVETIKLCIKFYDKNALVYLNEYLYTKNKNANFDFADNVNIEHIMPTGKNKADIQVEANIKDKNEFNRIVNELGNKILLEEDINKSIGKGWFKTKKQNSVKDKKGYKDSKYHIALALTEYPHDTWARHDVENATEKAATRIVTFIFNKKDEKNIALF